MTNFKGFGYLETVENEEITAGATLIVPLSSFIREHIGFVNVLFIINDSGEDHTFSFDGDSTRTVLSKAGTTMTVQGTRFRTVHMTNEHATETSAAGEVHITVQKDVLEREKMELRAAGRL